MRQCTNYGIFMCAQRGLGTGGAASGDRARAQPAGRAAVQRPRLWTGNLEGCRPLDGMRHQSFSSAHAGSLGDEAAAAAAAGGGVRVGANHKSAAHQVRLKVNCSRAAWATNQGGKVKARACASAQAACCATARAGPQPRARTVSGMRLNRVVRGRSSRSRVVTAAGPPCQGWAIHKQGNT